VYTAGAGCTNEQSRTTIEKYFKLLLIKFVSFALLHGLNVTKPSFDHALMSGNGGILSLLALRKGKEEGES
jgi:hypothetical protein